jgi:hypothetical protein
MIVTLLLALIGLQQPPRPCSTPDHRQFDFWIGDWDVKLANGQVAGRNRIELIEGGCGLQENWTSAGPSPNTGRSINAYSPGDKKWHQIWLGSGGQLMHLSGAFHGDTLTMEGQTTTAAGHTMHNRLAFTKRADGSVRQFWEQSPDGKSWKTAFEGIYTRRPQP